MEHILKSWANTIRFVLVLFIILLIINRIISSFTSSTNFEINYTTDKTLVTFIDKKNIIANSVLPASDYWINTGIEIRPGEEYEIKVSGKIHTVADKLIEDSEFDNLPRFGWVDAVGTEFKSRDLLHQDSDKNRKKLLLNPKAKVGAVLFYFKTNTMQEPNCDLRSTTPFWLPEDNKITVYEANGLQGKNESEETIFIWAAVNDMLLRDFSSASRIAYLGGAQGDKLEKKNKNWKILEKEKYNRLWYDDNFGEFILSAKITRPIPFAGFWNFN